MNSFQGHIDKVETHGSLSIVFVNIGNDIIIQAIVIDDVKSAPHLVSDQNITVLFKETEVIISTDLSPILSIQNRIKGHISAIEKGQLLSRLLIETSIGTIVSVISSQSIIELQLKTKTEVTAMVKINEVILSK